MQRQAKSWEMRQGRGLSYDPFNVIDCPFALQ